MLPAVLRRRRSRRAPGRSGPHPSLGAVELGRRLEALGGDLAQARAEAEDRAARLAAGLPGPASRPDRVGRPGAAGPARRLVVPVVAAALAATGTAVGLVLSGSGSPSGPPVTTADRRVTTRPAPMTTAGRPGRTGPPSVTTGRVPAGPVPVPVLAPARVAAPPARAGETSTIIVRAGQSFWSIAVSVITERARTASAAAPIGPYWVRLVEANADRLARPGDPDLLYPGQVLVLPTG